MGTGIHGGFGGTLGSTYQNDTNGTEEKSYSDRGISIPENLKTLLVKMPHKGDYVKGTKSDFSMTDVSILSKEARVGNYSAGLFSSLSVIARFYSSICNFQIVSLQPFSGSFSCFLEFIF